VSLFITTAVYHSWLESTFSQILPIINYCYRLSVLPSEVPSRITGLLVGFSRSAASLLVVLLTIFLFVSLQLGKLAIL